VSRASTIGAVVLASGILIGGSVFSVYAINSSIASDDAHLPVIKAVSAPSTLDANLEATTGNTSEVTAGDLEVTSTDEELIVPDVPVATPGQTAASTDQSIDPGNEPAAGQTQVRGPSVSSTTAQRAVLRYAGGRVMGTWTARHGGYSAYAIKIKRTDGSIIVGYVDRATGAVYDWTRVAGASTKPSRSPTAKPTSASRRPSNDSSRPSADANPTFTESPSDNGHSGDAPTPETSPNPENSGYSGQSGSNDQSDD
jgi:hypothetical protein